MNGKEILERAHSPGTYDKSLWLPSLLIMKRLVIPWFTRLAYPNDVVARFGRFWPPMIARLDIKDAGGSHCSASMVQTADQTTIA